MAQSLWAHAGGAMVQHNAWHTQSSYNSDQCHKITFTQNYLHYAPLLKEVNSRHHQTMDARAESGGVPQGVEVIAYASAAKKNSFFPSIVEMFRFTNRPIYGTQFHPEDQSDDDLIPGIIESLLNPE